jgi:hypothetical protein
MFKLRTNGKKKNPKIGNRKKEKIFLSGSIQNEWR